MRNSHEILGISVNATKEEIKSAYRKKVIEHHPDKCKSVDANQKFIEVTNAYKFLMEGGISSPITTTVKIKKSYQPSWKTVDISEKEAYDNLWARYSSTEKPQKIQYRPKIIKKEPEIDLWKQNETKESIFYKKYWKKYEELKNKMVYSEPEEFWLELEKWCESNRS